MSVPKTLRHAKEVRTQPQVSHMDEIFKVILFLSLSFYFP